VIRVLDPTGCGKSGALAGFQPFVTIILRSGVVVKRFAVIGFAVGVLIGPVPFDATAAQAPESPPDLLEQCRKRLAARRAPDFAVVGPPGLRPGAKPVGYHHCVVIIAHRTAPC
jgi:hypothetical protein